MKIPRLQTKGLLSQRGSILIQTAIAAGVVATTSLVMSSMLTNLFEQQRHITRKFEAQDLKSSLMTAAELPSFCSCNLAGPTGTKVMFNNTASATDRASANGAFYMYDSGCSTSSRQVLFQPNADVPGTRTNLRVGQPYFTGFQNIDGVKYSAELVLPLLAPDGAALAPITIGPIVADTAPEPAARRSIADCSTLAGLLKGKSCLPNQLLTGFDLKGMPICIARETDPQTNRGCPPPQVVTGFNAAGAPICANPTVAGVSCPTGQQVAGFTAAGTPYCTQPTIAGSGRCPAGQMMTGIQPSGAPICSGVPTQPAPSNPVANMSCPSGQFLMGFTGSGSPRCGNISLAEWRGRDGDRNGTPMAPNCSSGSLRSWVPISSYDNWSSVGVCTPN